MPASTFPAPIYWLRFYGGAKSADGRAAGVSLPATMGPGCQDAGVSLSVSARRYQAAVEPDDAVDVLPDVPLLLDEDDEELADSDDEEDEGDEEGEEDVSESLFADFDGPVELPDDALRLSVR
ncbi:fermentation-respiration switch protein FrsA (DUF1100 family) [Streptomyces zagrosensis]|uniref:Fermentation-respiration switch protein FrsA (DUF1100 family) n=1 Tax=Streptomyces zagrosensis TaxID=1042984 RepID=A0A7W9QH25_9ACTN|nr:fermentation-respiration switch protein FrsA (DUF1100 family) [Streptomyces zagrosensis]